VRVNSSADLQSVIEALQGDVPIRPDLREGAKEHIIAALVELMAQPDFERAVLVAIAKHQAAIDLLRELLQEA